MSTDNWPPQWSRQLGQVLDDQLDNLDKDDVDMPQQLEHAPF
jgi:hypothetical protein